MGKLTGRTLISANINENLLIHVVDTTGTPASFKANFSQLYGIFPKNASAGAGDVDYLARWTSANELGKGIVQDDGTALTVGGNSTINGELKVSNGGSSQIRILRDGEGIIYFSNSTNTADYGYIGQSSGNTYMRFVQNGLNAIEIDNSRNVDIKNSIQIRQTDGTAPVAGQYLKAINAQGEAEWGDVTGLVDATNGASQRVATFTDADTINGDANFTWSGSQLSVSSGNESSNITADQFENISESDDANLILKTYGATSIGSEIISGKYNGTFASPTALTNTQLISAHRIMGYDGSALATGALIETRASTTFSGTDRGVYYLIQTCATGEASPTERFRINDSGDTKITGNLGVGTDPDTEMHVKGSGITLKLETTSDTGNNYLTFFDTVGQKGYIGYSGSSENYIILNDEVSGEIQFWTTDSGNNTTEALTITGDNNVIINNGGLDVISTAEGIQMPRWTSAQQTTNTSGWGSTQQGTIWFNTDTKQFMGWNSTSSVILG
jgi:hypothetical protein